MFASRIDDNGCVRLQQRARVCCGYERPMPLEPGRGSSNRRHAKRLHRFTADDTQRTPACTPVHPR